MSALPPYSTYRTDKHTAMMYPQQLSHGNILTFTPPGFNQVLNVKFPDCRLAVCDKCKRNYKTRDMCRVRNNHTAAPWTTAYICVTLDDNCTDDEGNYVDKPFAVRMIQWQPYCVTTAFPPKTPVCSACKKTNRTRSFCRERHKHRQLPWCTVYVLLSPADTIDPSTRIAPESTKTGEGGGKQGEAEDDSGKPAAKKESEESHEKEAQEKQDEPKAMPVKSSGGNQQGDDINDIAESRTFLAQVAHGNNTIHWLELAEFDASDSGNLAMAAPDSVPYARGEQSQPAPQYAFASPTMYAAPPPPPQGQYQLKPHQQYIYQIQHRHQQQYAAQQAAWQAHYNPQLTAGARAAATASPASPSPAPTATTPTAGEAAAAKHNSPSTAGDQAETAGAAAAAVAAQGYGHYPNYHQQLYQSQMAQFQQAGGILPQQPGATGELDYGMPVTDDGSGGDQDVKRQRVV